MDSAGIARVAGVLIPCLTGIAADRTWRVLRLIERGTQVDHSGKDTGTSRQRHP
jgi:hypothetical protein